MRELFSPPAAGPNGKVERGARGGVALNPKPYTLNPELSTLNPQPSTLNTQHSTLNTQHSTLKQGTFPVTTEYVVARNEALNLN